ncbi:MAG: site-specific integrase [Proteobacteria bacterium]|nr:site-specific integrase [Pseudomonadota bacterium]
MANANTYRPQPIRLALIRALAKARPPSKPREIRDKAAHLILRHQPSGYLGLYVELGRGKRERLCDASSVIDSNSKLTLKQVKTEADRKRSQHADGRSFSAERHAERDTPTLTAYLNDTYGPWVVQNRRSGTNTLERLKSCFKDHFGKIKLTDITLAKLETWRTARQRKGVKAETINRDIAALRAAISRAVKLGIIKENPIADVEMSEVDRHRRVVRALTANEKKNLIDALAARDEQKRQERASANKWRHERRYEPLPTIGRFSDVLTPAVIVSLETGLRRGELFATEWPSIDFDNKNFRVEGATAKTFETREIPLNDFACKTLRDWWLQCGQPKGGYVFTLDGGRIVDNLKKSFSAVLEAAGVEYVNARGERVTWHSLRHTFGSLLGAANVDPTTLMRLMGHANLATTQRYLHTDEKRKREAVALLQTAN